MSLRPRSTLSHYEILAPLGAGAMGEVYRARDTRLGREVAIKVLPAHFATDAERLARFEREARSLAALNHPNIAQIYAVDHADGTYFLALELVPGETLDDRLKRAPLPLDEVLDIARQIAEGLEAAHEAGVIHRDLKPANVRITPDGKVKLLDFGLAKPARTATGESDDTPSPADSVLTTGEGRLLGTPTYMAPEQARGRPIDRRVDIWAFGCVLFECLTGERAFSGATLGEVLAAVLDSEPELSLLPAATPPLVRALVARCLVKDPHRRLRDAGDARLELERSLVPGDTDAIATPTATRFTPASLATWPTAAWLVAAAALGAAATVTAILLLRGRPSAPPVAPPLRVALAVRDLETSGFAADPVLSRDGRSIAYLSRGHLRILSLERIDDRAVPASDHADAMFWSPSGDAIGFARDRRLWIWPLGASDCREVCGIPGSGTMNGALWMPDGTIYFCPFADGIYAVSATGGEPTLALALDDGEFDFHLPAPLPREDEFVAVTHRHAGPQQIFVFTCVDRRRHPILEMDEVATAAWSPAGYLLLTRNWTTQDIWAVRFSPEARRVEGEPFLVDRGGQFPSIAATGAMIFTQGDRESLFDLLWIGRDGSSKLVPGGPFQGMIDPAISPDGRTIVFSAVKDDQRDLWILDLERGTRSRLTSDAANDLAPRWSADGRTIFYTVWSPGKQSLWRIDVSEGATPTFLADAYGVAPMPDGSSVVIAMEGKDRDDLDLWILPLAADASGSPAPHPVPLVQSRFEEDQPAISPDGRWIVHTSNETGESEVYLRRLPDGGSKVQLSVGGGSNPMWGPTGNAVYYWWADALMEVTLDFGEGDASPQPQRPRPVVPASELRVGDAAENGRLGFGLSADGQRFLVVRRSPDDPRAGILYAEDFDFVDR